MYRDDVREYLEIAVLAVTLGPAAKATRLMGLIHGAVPYPVVLAAVQDGAATLSLAHSSIRAHHSRPAARPLLGNLEGEV